MVSVALPKGAVLAGLGFGLNGDDGTCTAPFPLTPALSLREREHLRMASSLDGALGFAPAIGGQISKEALLYVDAGFSESSRAWLPLPEGEGWSEGEEAHTLSDDFPAIQSTWDSWN